MTTPPDPLDRLHFDTQALMRAHPPIWRDRNKLVVFEVTTPPGSIHAGHLDYSRWAPMALPPTVDPAAAARRVVGRPGFFDYAPLPDVEGAVEWHLNFADPNLFAYYGSSLFAQDEIQVAEHPALGALRQALVAQGKPTATVEHGRPTPVLVMGVERRCAVSTEPNATEGRPYGLYGNRFVQADPDAVRRATRRIEPPTITNVIAVAAPSGGYGLYTAAEVQHVLTTAYTAFRAAVIESRRTAGDGCPVVVHTGYWGCGAFGGNRALMAALQALAGELAGLERLVFHVGQGGGDVPLSEALGTLDDELAHDAPPDTPHLISRLVGMGFQWGVGDGN